jgi:hypothetical protein
MTVSRGGGAMGKGGEPPALTPKKHDRIDPANTMRPETIMRMPPLAGYQSSGTDCLSPPS